MNQDAYLKTLEDIYIQLLRLPTIHRIEVQTSLCLLRDAIADIKGEDAEEVQDYYETASLYPPITA